MNPPKRVFIIAGEASGDLHAANLVRAIERLQPGIAFEGLGGPRMAAAGVRVRENVVENLAIIGFGGVIKNYPQLRALFHKVYARLEESRPDAVLLVDYPGFNLRVARRAKAMGLRTVYYICPQTWAWHESRARAFPRILDRMLTIFPFEEPLFRGYGANATFVGHPLLDLIEVTKGREDVCADLGLDPGRPILALLPGSRRSEVEPLLPVMLAAGMRLRRSMPDLQFVLPRAETIRPEVIEQITRRFDLPVTVAASEKHNVRAAADFAWVASGTATLETALLGVPMVILYKVPWATYVLLKRLVKLPHIGLPNIVAQKGIVPELLQAEATPEILEETTRGLLNDAPALEAMKRELQQVRVKLQGGGGAQENGAYARAAQVFLETIGQ